MISSGMCMLRTISQIRKLSAWGVPFGLRSPSARNTAICMLFTPADDGVIVARNTLG
jgi:hypothetical protein